MDKREKQLLLSAARTSIETYFSGEKMEIIELGIRRGSFVTLQEDGELRGCIGYMTGIDDLYRQVVSLAREAAFNDYRFPPLRRDELDLITIEISVLTEPKAIDSLQSFKLGEDGIIMTLNNQRAVYLPQVAIETGWNKAELLSSLSRKAGLPPNAWQNENASFMTFNAEVFSESNL